MVTEQGTEARAMERRRWLQERRSGLGGSDAAAVLGLSPWAGPIDVWQEKMGTMPDRPDNEAMWWGRELEDIIRRRYTETTGFTVAKPDGMFRHPEHDCLLANVDGLVFGCPRARGLEVKTASVRMADQWGDAGGDAIPTHYVIQCCHYMLVTGMREWDVAALIGGSDFRVYHLRADPELEAFLLDRLTAFWRDYVLTGAEPPIDASQGAADYLQRKFPGEAFPTIIQAGPEAERWMERLAAARRAAVGVEEEQDLCENNVKALIGDAAGLQADRFRVTWKRTKDRTFTDFEAYATAMENQLQIARGWLAAKAADLGFKEAASLPQMLGVDEASLLEMKVAATDLKPGTRRFLFKETPAA